jgi:hypothetical protein
VVELENGMPLPEDYLLGKEGRVMKSLSDERTLGVVLEKGCDIECAGSSKVALFNAMIRRSKVVLERPVVDSRAH